MIPKLARAIMEVIVVLLSIAALYLQAAWDWLWYEDRT